MSLESPAASGDGATVAASADRSELEATEYVVPDWIRVRQESFGLLFYDTRSTKLTFVRSGDSLVPPPLASPHRALRLGTLDERRRPAMLRLLESLDARGLIHASEAE